MHMSTTNKHTLLLTLALMFSCLFAAPSYAADATSEASAISVETGKLNINTADANSLAATMKGIGIKKAKAIVEYRNTYGPFADILELEDVKGIGRKTIEKNAGLIAVN